MYHGEMKRHINFTHLKLAKITRTLEFVGKCLVCQHTKYSRQAEGGLLQPLPTVGAVWEEASMDFITGLPMSKGMTVILVVVDRLSKYAHFRTLLFHYNAKKVA